ncbi:hypothetical protein ABIA69_000002 [Lysinibacillus parviboronicapiens]|uniref:MucB/RseB N-terminal domain-containing protein n=1 Tax=Lysinibacillus parviboronicapiens TaxID=436516 RepID=A0ABV2PDY4_9BACI
MDEKLKKLRNHMTTTELKNIRFDDKKKQSVMKSIINQKKPSKNLIPKGVSIVFSLAVITLLFFSGKHLLFDSSDLVQGSQKNSGEIVNQEEITQSDNTNESIVSSHEKTPELSKNEILYRMLNTMDYFKTAQGSYVYRNPYVKQNIVYKLNMEKGNIGGYEQAVNEQSKSSITTIVKSDQMLTLNEKEKEYLLEKASSLNRNSISLKEVYGADAQGTPDTTYRKRPPIAMDSLFPFEIASNYLEDEEQWEIEQQEDTFLGEKVMIIKGNLNAYNSEKPQSVSFRFWVHKATGILMRMETYSAEGNVVYSLVTQKFILDKPIPSSEFQLNIPKDYKKMM